MKTWLVLLRYGATILLGAFLLFSVQPLIARAILPWFGGTTGVWSTCMLFFQVLLLGGYAYAHGLNRWVGQRAQGVIHLLLLLASLLVLPIIPDPDLQPRAGDTPVLQILLVLLLTIGLPYLLVTATGPLLQAWFTHELPGRSPYRLFALSNLGSLFALVSYPTLFEPWLRQEAQAFTWSWGYGGFVLLCLLTAWRRTRNCDEVKQDVPMGSVPSTQPSKPLLVFWIALAAVPSTLLLAVTNQVCQEVAVVPFLWVIPLGLYLLTFILCFEFPGFYRRGIVYPLLLVFMILATKCLYVGVRISIDYQLVGYFGVLFLACLCCHGELCVRKPHPRFLTLYYLCLAIGGAVGGIFVVLVAPLVFSSYAELHVGLIAALLLGTVTFLQPFKRRVTSSLPLTCLVACFCLLLPALAGLLIYQPHQRSPGIWQERNFYGVLTVVPRSDPAGEVLVLKNGQILHGKQAVAPAKRRTKTSYYCEGSGVDLAIGEHPKRSQGRRLRVGAIGLGVGTLSAHVGKGEVIRFYEINPQVLEVADAHFSFMRDTEAAVETVLGDARIELQREADARQFQRFDVLAVDAFTSDAIPRHLLTEQAFRLYLKHLNADGVIAVHISNRFLDLKPILHRLAREVELTPLLLLHDAKGVPLGEANHWVLMTRNKAFLASPKVRGAVSDWPSDLSDLLWTDDFGSLWQVLNRR
ncbi:MAG: fused MFS/spermidine synthase [Planctomycetota bacterium]